MNRLARYSWLTLVVNVAVVLWGAVVRATGSGAGCGRHWPKCNGEVMPTLRSAKTMIEFSHRLTSGIALLMVVWLAVQAYRVRRDQPTVVRPAVASLVFMILEALLGAGLVLLRLVELDASVTRAISMALHLTNTFFLLGALTWTASAATFETRPSWVHAPSLARFLVVGGTALLLVTGVTGAIAALGDTLFPASTLAQGIAQDQAPTAHFLLRLRAIHPFVAVGAATLLVLATNRLAEDRSARITWLARLFQLSLAVQIVVGVTNLVLLVPLATQLVHLLVADAVVISFALLAAHTLGPRSTSAEIG